MQTSFYHSHGSIFEGSKVELRKWFQAAYELSTSKKGIGSVELGTRIGVSQKTAWFINHRIRTMSADTALGMLGGIVEADETFGDYLDLTVASQAMLSSTLSASTTTCRVRTS